MTEQQCWIVGGVALYLLVMLGIGFYASRLVKTQHDYIVAGGRLGWALSIGTIFATWFGSETCMGAAGKSFDNGFLGVIIDPFGAGLCLILSGILFAKYFRKLRIDTIMDYFQMRYGRKISILFGILYVPVYLGWIGAQLKAFGIILNSLTGIDNRLSTLIGYETDYSVFIATAVVILYTYWGGMWADTLTDFFQMIVLIGGLLYLFPVIVGDLGGWEAATAAVEPEKWHFFPHNADSLTWLNYLELWMIVGIGSLPAQDLFQRIMAARDGVVAKWSSIIAGVLYIAFGLIPVTIGILAKHGMPEAQGEDVLIALALKYLSGPATALMVGALLSAIMSSADSAILAPASIIGHNILPVVWPKATDHHRLMCCRYAVPVITIASLVMALHYEYVYELCSDAWSFLLVGIAASMFFGVFWERASTAGAMSSAVVGTAAWLAFRAYLPQDADGASLHPCALYGFVISCVTLVIVSLLTTTKYTHASLDASASDFTAEEAAGMRPGE